MPWDEQEQRAELREQLPLPDRSMNPLTKIIQEAVASGADMNQLPLVKNAQVTLALYFERLPTALRALPFVQQETLPPFPHLLERGIRPPGSFFDFFSAEDEAAFWAYSLPDFTTFGYERFTADLPAAAPNALRLL